MNKSRKKKHPLRTLSLEELANLTKLPTSAIQGFAAKGIYRGLQHGRRFHPFALATTEAAVEIGGLHLKGSLADDEARALFTTLRPRGAALEQAWFLALSGRPVSIDITLDGRRDRIIRLHGAHRAATAFEQLALAS